MPVVATELLRVRRGFEVVADEADQARAALLDVETRGIGTPACDAAVEAGLRALEAVIARLETLAADCALAVSRYDAPTEELS